MIVAHANGFFYENGKFFAKEVALCDTNLRWKGFVVKTTNLLFSQKDLKSNLYIFKHISGIPFTKEDEAIIEPGDVPEKLQSLLREYFDNTQKIYVKGSGLQSFFSEMLPGVEIFNMDAKWPNVNTLDITKHPSHTLHTTEGHCAKDVALAYAKCLKEEDEYWD